MTLRQIIINKLSCAILYFYENLVTKSYKAANYCFISDHVHSVVRKVLSFQSPLLLNQPSVLVHVLHMYSIHVVMLHHIVYVKNGQIFRCMALMQ